MQQELTGKAIQIASIRGLGLQDGTEAVLKILLGHDQPTQSDKVVVDAVATYENALRAFGIFQSDSQSQ